LLPGHHDGTVPPLILIASPLWLDHDNLRAELREQAAKSADARAAAQLHDDERVEECLPGRDKY
jgi:hypothetical protein